MELDYTTIKLALKEVLTEEFPLGYVEMAHKWKGGKVLFQPEDPQLKANEIPMDKFFAKVTSVREKLRVLEQKLNNNKNLSPEEKNEFQQLLTRAYGSLTSFNVLFRLEDDKFKGIKS